MMHLIVCGGRDYANYRRVDEELRRIQQLYGIRVIIHGAARGADSLARRWAEENDVNHIPVPAEWDLYGRSAGMRRNQEMLDEYKPDGVLAFLGGVGTAGMVRIARKAGVKVREVFA